MRQVNIREDDDFLRSMCPVDCITAILALNLPCDSDEDFKRSIRQQVSRLRPGGTLLAVVDVHSSYWEIGGQIYRYPYTRSDYLLECLQSTGMKDVSLKMFPGATKNAIGESFDYVFLSAKLTHPQTFT